MDEVKCSQCKKMDYCLCIDCVVEELRWRREGGKDKGGRWGPYGSASELVLSRLRSGQASREEGLSRDSYAHVLTSFRRWLVANKKKWPMEKVGNGVWKNMSLLKALIVCKPSEDWYEAVLEAKEGMK